MFLALHLTCTDNYFISSRLLSLSCRFSPLSTILFSLVVSQLTSIAPVDPTQKLNMVNPPSPPSEDAEPPSPGKSSPPADDHVPRDEDDNDDDNDNDEASESDDAKPKEEKQVPFPVNMAPAPAQQAAKMIPRQSEQVKESKGSKPDVPPKQVVAVKDTVLSHAPRAADKKHHHQTSTKQTPQSPVAKVADTVIVSKSRSILSSQLLMMPLGETQDGDWVGVGTFLNEYPYGFFMLHPPACTQDNDIRLP
jgi:hypothetical protein